MQVAGVVIVGEEAFGRACISLALAPHMLETPVVYCGPSAHEALTAAAALRPVTAVVDLNGPEIIGIPHAVERLLVEGLDVVVVAAGVTERGEDRLRAAGVRAVIDKGESGLRDVVSAVFGDLVESAPLDARYVPLSQTQRRVMAMFAMGVSCQDIGRELGVSTETVKTHLKRVRAKYEARGVALPSRAHVYRAAVMSGAIV